MTEGGETTGGDESGGDVGQGDDGRGDVFRRFDYVHIVSPVTYFAIIYLSLKEFLSSCQTACFNFECLVVLE